MIFLWLSLLQIEINCLVEIFCILIQNHYDSYEPSYGHKHHHGHEVYRRNDYHHEPSYESYFADEAYGREPSYESHYADEDYR